MWAELFCISATEQNLIADYSTIGIDFSLTDLHYVPELRKRLGLYKKDVFLSKLNEYRSTIINNRIVVLCAAFEAYFLYFLDSYIENRPRYYNTATSSRTNAGNKLYGEIKKARGLVARINAFSDQSGREIKSITPHLDHISDLYLLRNIMAHAAGLVDLQSSIDLKIFKFSEGDFVNLNSDQLIELADKTILVARSLDSRITPK
jgi:hypothetical protein